MKASRLEVGHNPLRLGNLLFNRLSVDLARVCASAKKVMQKFQLCHGKTSFQPFLYCRLEIIFLFECVCHWNYMENFFLSSRRFAFLLSSVKTYFIMLLCKGVLDINSGISSRKHKKEEGKKLYGNLFIDFDSFPASPSPPCSRLIKVNCVFSFLNLLPPKLGKNFFVAHNNIFLLFR